jgi:glucosamine--fructose-6-phosphate aminotransferase (isomerizing)
MCGIFGIVTAREPSAEALVRALFRLSESRGKEAAGLAGVAGDRIAVLKSPVPASQLMRTAVYRAYLDDVVRGASRGVALVGHSRLVTNGSQAEHANNQPVNVDGIVGVHNGIIVNDASLWEAHPELGRVGDVDTEILFRLIRRFATAERSLVGGLRRTYAEAVGVANIAVFASELDQLMLATNSGSIYYSYRAGFFAFASEEYILTTALRRAGLDGRGLPITQLVAGTGLLVDLSAASLQAFSLTGAASVTERNGVHRTIRAVDPVPVPASPSAAVSRRPPGVDPEVPPAWFTDAAERNREVIQRLRRCVRCVQPETVPFIGLDEDGLCVDCRNFQPIVARGHDALVQVLAPHRARDGRPEVLVPLSGGRDSCYALHYIKTVLGLHPIAYTYDWGMVTDLARRNASRMCSQLGVEHIIVSADIVRKRAYIRKNVEAWLRRPDLGIVPLFMAGDKQFFHHAEQLQRRTGVKFQIWGNNRLERSDFKTGFCGFDRGGYKDNSLIRMGAWHNARLIGYYLAAYARNPAYVNASIPDTLFSYFFYYLKKLEYLDFYDYVPWDEDTIVRTLIDRYQWEVATDTRSTWRIGDGTAAFYNYIYWTAAGFTESDTFRSGQIRQGTLSRADAQRVVDDENQPRYASLTWYCRTVGLDLERTLRVINAIPKRYAI